MAVLKYVTSINGQEGSYPFRPDPKRVVDGHNINAGAETISLVLQSLAANIQPLVLKPGTQSGDYILGLGTGGFKYSESK